MRINTNSIILTGNLTRDAELKYTPNNKPVLQFTVACNRQGVNGSDVDYFNIVLWGKSGEALAKYMTKGKGVLVKGRLQTRSYEAKDGTKKTVYEIIADAFAGVELLGGGQQSQAQPQAQSRNWNPLDVEPEPQAPVQRADQSGIPF